MGLKQMGHFESVTSRSSFWQVTQFMALLRGV
jgi:hypothetical protein